MPVSVETSNYGLSTGFYDKRASLDYGSASHDFSELTRASKVLDCRSVEGESAESYQTCAHVVMETWLADHGGGVIRGIEAPRDLGALGSTHLWVPRFTAERDPSLSTYLRLSGEKNRHRLAETFKRPTTWKTYCEEVSTDNCATDDGVASRSPGAEEEDSMFVEGLYTGHFRATEENDCNNFPNTCNGHVADYPCEWKSFVTQQMHHLDIALRSSGPSLNGGYTYSQLNEIWHAANATKSDVMMLWWTPEALFDMFRKYLSSRCSRPVSGVVL